ncbi:amidohydrolase family protein [Kurthia sp. FSL E2-0154]|uniref:amidohydrolase family protein n=1 Tax=Kurthia sp. FSL E2-0154 TaxID=2921358 RepID=UPI0030FCA83C
MFLNATLPAVVILVRFDSDDMLGDIDIAWVQYVAVIMLAAGNATGLAVDGAGAATLAGSVLTIDAALKYMKQLTNCTMEELVAMSSANAVQQLNETNKGEIRVGADADFVLLDKDLIVQKTIKKSKVVFEAHKM